MASMTFVPPDGKDRTYQLDPRRTLRVGRDPSNDVVLSDPKASRHHAQIVFEKGFFVVYDLGSSNGTFVRGKRVQVAPLVDGVELKIGNTVARFSAEQEPSSPPPTQPGLRAPGDVRPSSARPLPVTEPGEGEPTPQPFRPDEEDSKKSAVDGDAFVFELSHSQAPSVVRDHSNQPLLFFNRPPRLVAFLAALVAAMIAVTGTMSIVVLALQKRPLPLAVAVLLTAVFFVAVLALVPRRQVLFCMDEQMSQVDMMLLQDHIVPFPAVRYSARDREGAELAIFHKYALTNLGRRRWWFAAPSASGYAEEDSLPRAMARKVAGRAFRALRSNWRILADGKVLGWIDGRERAPRLDLSSDSGRALDRRIAIPLAALIVLSER